MSTTKRVEVVNITPPLQHLVSKSSIADGVLYIFLQHTSAGLALQEDEPLLRADMERFLERFAAERDLEDPQYLHNQTWRRPVPPDEPKNADAHIKGLLVGSQVAIPITGGKLQLGRWQQALLLEMDGPREREVLVMVQGETVKDGLAQYWRDKVEVINRAIEPFLAKNIEPQMLGMSHYITTGGKRLRGTLTLLVAEVLGGDPTRALDAAVAIELVHAATLAKDDAQDGDKTRRGKLAAWVVYGIRKATAMTDVLIPHAITMVQKYGKEAVYATIAAWKEIGVGQVKDLFLASFKDGKLYEEIVRQKTGALFGLAATLGAIASKATKEQKQLATNYGRKLGYLFQVVDDLADFEQGKPVPLSFETWLAGEPARQRIDNMTEEVQMLARDFPDHPLRRYLEELPQFAVEQMLAEAQKQGKL